MDPDTEERDVERVPVKKADESGTEVACERCSISGLCLPGEMGDAERVALNQIVQRARPLRKGAHLFRAGDRGDCVYALRTGTIKSYRVTSDGEEQVTGFFFPGEVVGLESLSGGDHLQHAIALDTSLVCRIPIDQYERLAERVPAMRRQLVRVMSRELHHLQERLVDARHTGAPATLAAFLVDLSDRFARRGLAGDHLLLPMSRGDMANYLGLTLETVSRVLSRFQSEGLLAVHGRDLNLLDLDGLRRYAACGLHACGANKAPA